MQRSFRLFGIKLYLDVSDQVKLVPGGDGWMKLKTGFKWYNLGRKHSHMTILSLYVCGWLFNIRRPSLADVT